jgi:hypothetical protein
MPFGNKNNAETSVLFQFWHARMKTPKSGGLVNALKPNHYEPTVPGYYNFSMSENDLTPRSSVEESI